MVDNRVHLQQSASISKVGYKAFYDHILNHSQGMSHYGCTRASGKTLAKDRLKTEKAVQYIHRKKAKVDNTEIKTKPFIPPQLYGRFVDLSKNTYEARKENEGERI